MKLAIFGLGKTGMNLALNLMENNHEVIAYDMNAELMKEADRKGATGVQLLEEVAGDFSERKIIWMTVPSGDITENLLNEVTPLLSDGDVMPLYIRLSSLFEQEYEAITELQQRYK